MYKDGYEFIGWYIGNIEWDFDTNTVKRDIALHSEWREIEREDWEEPIIPDSGSEPSGGCSGSIDGIAGGMFALVCAATVMLLKKKKDC